MVTVTGHEGLHAPDCTVWCIAHADPGWDQDAAGEVSKTCRRIVECVDDADGFAVQIELRRFASVEEGAVVLDDPLIERIGGGALRPSAAMLIAETVMRIVEMVDEPPCPAAA